MKINMKFTHKLVLVALAALMIVPTQTKTDVLEDVAYGCAAVAGGIAFIGGLAWLFSKTDIQKIERAEEKIRSANYVLKELDNIVKGVLDVNSNVQDEVHNLYAAAVRASNADKKITNIRAEINRCLNSATSARNGVQNVLNNLRGQNTYELSYEDRKLRDRSQSALNDINDRIENLQVRKRFFTNFGDYFDIFEQETKIFNKYKKELKVYEYWHTTNYNQDVRVLVDQLKPCVVHNCVKYPFISYVSSLENTISIVRKLERDASHKYYIRRDVLNVLMQNFIFIRDVLKSSDGYQNDVYCREQVRCEQERMRLERQRIDAMQRQARAQEAQAREMHRHNNQHIQRRCRVCIYDYTCVSCDWLKWCSSCNYNRSCVCCDLREPKELSLRLTVNL
jgi:hypothetical protein